MWWTSERAQADVGACRRLQVDVLADELQYRHAGLDPFRKRACELPWRFYNRRCCPDRDPPTPAATHALASAPAWAIALVFPQAVARRRAVHRRRTTVCRPLYDRLPPAER